MTGGHGLWAMQERCRQSGPSGEAGLRGADGCLGVLLRGCRGSSGGRLLLTALGQQESFAMGSLQDDQVVAALFKVRTAIELFEDAPANSAEAYQGPRAVPVP